MDGDRWDEQVGSVADEAARLLESLRRAAEVPDDAARASATGAAEGTDGCVDPVCQWCPVCRGAAVVRRLSPETLSRLAEVATVAATVLADLAAQRTPAPAPEARPEEPAGASSARPGRPRSESIPVREARGAGEEVRRG